MDIHPPSWQMKVARCGYCDEGELIFSQCPACGVVVVICAECGTVYGLDEHKPGKEVGDMSDGTLCHGCGKSPHHEFSSASADTIQSMGFSNSDYE